MPTDYQRANDALFLQNFESLNKDIADIKIFMSKINEALYTGNGKEPFTVRIDRLEGFMSGVKKFYWLVFSMVILPFIATYLPKVIKVVEKLVNGI